MKQLHVAAGILRDRSGRVLIAERKNEGPFNGLWEFPGGKIAAGEDPADALRRELAEELGIDIEEFRPFMALHHDYPDRSVDLEFFLVTAWHGEPAGLEGQLIRWVQTSGLDAGQMLPADAPVVKALTHGQKDV